MKRISILSMFLVALCLTGCQQINSEDVGANQEQETIEDKVTEVGDADIIEEKVTEVGNTDKNEETNSQSTDLDKTDSQKDIDLEENDINLINDIDTIEEINEYMIPEQSFDITLDDWGEVKFVSCKPQKPVFSDYEASFFLIRDEQILYIFPYMNEHNKKAFTGCFYSVEAVAFRDINDDGKKDIIIIFHYISGAGPTGMVPRPKTRIFLAGENEFYLAKDIIADVEKNILEKDMTIENICNYLQ